MRSQIAAALVLLLATVLWATSVTAQETAINRLDNLLSAMSLADEFSGSILVAKEGEVIYQNAFGMADKDHEIQYRFYWKTFYFNCHSSTDENRRVKSYR